VLSLAFSGCASTQSQARQEATERWNQVRAQVKAKLASDQLAAGHIEDAATELAAAFRLDPANPELRTLQARICLAQGDLPAAERLLKGARAEDKPRAEIDYLLGVIQEQRLHLSAALEHFLRAADEEPHEVAYVVASVQVMLQLGQVEEARALLESRQPELGWTSAYHAALAECCEQLDDWAGAASAWQKVAGANDDPGIRERLAMALYRAGRGAEAIPQLAQLLDEPETQASVPLRLALAECLLENRQPGTAHDQLRLVLREHPRNVTALRLLARAFAQQQQFDRARQTAEQALQLAPDDPQTLELAAALAFRTGDKTRARLLAEQILQSFPDMDSSVARHILAQHAATSSTAR